MERQESIEQAKKYIEDIISFFGIKVDVTVQDDGDIVSFMVPSTSLNSLLIGKNAETMRSIQGLVMSMLKSNNSYIERINIDIADYKKHREEWLSKEAKEWIQEVIDTGNSKIMKLNAADRRIVHQVAAEYDNIRTFSEGEGRDRHIIISQIVS
jgi:spoIIIJ-associated protein